MAADDRSKLVGCRYIKYKCDILNVIFGFLYSSSGYFITLVGNVLIIKIKLWNQNGYGLCLNSFLFV